MTSNRAISKKYFASYRTDGFSVPHYVVCFFMNRILHAVTILFLAVAGAADEPRQTHSDSQVPDMIDLDDLQPFGVASSREITTLIRQLGGKQFKDRESAQNTLEIDQVFLKWIRIPVPVSAAGMCVLGCYNHCINRH